MNYPIGVLRLPLGSDIEIFDEEQLVDFEHSIVKVEDIIATRKTEGPFKGKAIYLSPFYNYRIVRDTSGLLCLLVLKG